MSEPPSREETEQEKQDRQELTALLLLLIANTKQALIELTERLTSGEIKTYEFGQEAAELLGEAHAEAASYGRRLAGVGGEEITDADRSFGASMMLEQESFLRDFLDDIEHSPSYSTDGVLNLERIEWRAGLYADALWGTANAAWTYAQPETYEEYDEDTQTEVTLQVLFWWQDVGDERECSTCPVLAAGSPYTRDQMEDVGFPGAADTECGNRCRCTLSSSTGATSFLRP